MQHVYQTNWFDKECYFISNPLVVILGIGKYGGSVMPDLEGVAVDCANARYTVNYKLGWSTVYMTDKEVFRHLKTPTRYTQDNFKLYWTANDIFSYHTKIIRLFENPTNIGDVYDSLIYITSSHGDTNDVMISSDGDNLKLESTLNAFDNNNCIYLRHKPKLFILDRCRGDGKLKYEVNPHTINQSNKMERNVAVHKGKMLQLVFDSIAYTMASVQKEHQITTRTKHMRQVSTGTYSFIERLESIRLADESKDELGNNLNNNKLDWKQKYELLSLSPKSDFHILFGNVDGYATADGQEDGGYLIRSILKVMQNEDMINNYTFSELIQQARFVKDAIIGKGVAQTFEEVRKINYPIKFRPKAFHDNLLFGLVPTSNNKTPKLTKQPSIEDAYNALSSISFLGTNICQIEVKNDDNNKEEDVTVVTFVPEAQDTFEMVHNTEITEDSIPQPTIYMDNDTLYIKNYDNVMTSIQILRQSEHSQPTLGPYKFYAPDTCKNVTIESCVMCRINIHPSISTSLSINHCGHCNITVFKDTIPTININNSDNLYLFLPSPSIINSTFTKNVIVHGVVEIQVRIGTINQIYPMSLTFKLSNSEQPQSFRSTFNNDDETWTTKSIRQ